MFTLIAVMHFFLGRTLNIYSSSCPTFRQMDEDPESKPGEKQRQLTFDVNDRPLIIFSQIIRRQRSFLACRNTTGDSGEPFWRPAVDEIHNILMVFCVILNKT